jgi:hypothetical protein
MTTHGPFSSIDISSTGLGYNKFWLDTIGEWEKETGKHPVVAISATKDVQDAILADPVRSKLIDVIDIQYWWYQSDGKVYAPEGGKNLSPRQWSRRLLRHRGPGQGLRRE